MTISRKFILAAAVAVVAVASGVFASGFVHGAQANVSLANDDAQQLAQQGIGTRVATFTNGQRALYVQSLQNGMLCISDATFTGAGAGGGCNPASDPLSGHPFVAILAYDGGPSIAAAANARIYGLAQASIARLTLVMTDKSMRDIKLGGAVPATRGMRPFAYSLSDRDLASGVGPSSIVAIGQGGAVLDEQRMTVG